MNLRKQDEIELHNSTGSLYAYRHADRIAFWLKTGTNQQRIELSDLEAQDLAHWLLDEGATAEAQKKS